MRLSFSCRTLKGSHAYQLLKNVWPYTFVDENSLAQSVSVLHSHSDRSPAQQLYRHSAVALVSVYFACTVVAPRELSCRPSCSTAASHPPSVVIFQQQLPLPVSSLKQTASSSTRVTRSSCGAVFEGLECCGSRPAACLAYRARYLLLFASEQAPDRERHHRSRRLRHEYRRCHLR